MKSLRKSIFTAVIVAVLVVALFAGTTYAWFSDSILNTGNKIQAGTLSIEAGSYNLGTGGLVVKNENTLLNDGADIEFEADGLNLKTADKPIIVENNFAPGTASARLLHIRNAGSLNSKIALRFTIGGDLVDALWFDLIRVYPDETGPKLLPAADFNRRPMKTLPAYSETFKPTLAGDSSIYFMLLYGFYESAGNNYQNFSFTADVNIYAAQTDAAESGFDDDYYDTGAVFPERTAEIEPFTVTKQANSGADTLLRNSQATALVKVPAGTVDEGLHLSLSVADAEPDGNLTIGADSVQVSYDISVEGLPSNNDKEIAVSLFIGKGLQNVVVYHYDKPVDGAVYDADSGYVNFTTTSFSPFTFIYTAPQAVSGDVYFSSFEMAAKSAQGAIELLKDVTLSGSLTVSQPIVIDENSEITINLNGNKLTSAHDSVVITNYGTLSITDNGGNVGEISAKSGCVLANFGTVNVNNGKLTAADNLTVGATNNFIIVNGSDSYLGANAVIANAEIYGSTRGLISCGGGSVTVENGIFALGTGIETDLDSLFRSEKSGTVTVSGGKSYRNVDNTTGGFFRADNINGTVGIRVIGGYYEDKANTDVYCNPVWGEGVTEIDYDAAKFPYDAFSYDEIKGENNNVVSYAVKGIGTSDSENIVIGPIYRGLPVTKISNNAFAGTWSAANKKLKSAYIPDSVTEIAQSAFYKCTELTTVSLPDNLTAIPSNIFQECTKLTTIKLPEKTESIGPKAFSDTGLTEIILPSNVKTLGENSFYNCLNLSTVTLNEGLNTIGNSAFALCAKITTIAIPDSVEVIDIYAFNGCSKLSNVTLGSGLKKIKQSAFNWCPITTITIPASVVLIEAGAFTNTSLTKAEFKDVTGWQTDKVSSNSAKNAENLKAHGFGSPSWTKEASAA